VYNALVRFHTLQRKPPAPALSMLKELSIRNFAIIDDLSIRFEEGLSVLTGETGAGKSIIINAVNLILGSRASTDMIRTGAEAAELEALDLSSEDAGGSVMRPAIARMNMIRAQLANRTHTGLRLGRYGEAEQAARQRLALPPNPVSEFDPQDEIARAKISLAHALVGQGRQDEARQVLDAELPRYRKLQDQGAQGLDFRRDLAHALYVDAIARPAQDPQRRAALVAARRSLDGLSAEARQLLDIRELYVRIAAAG